MIRALILLLLLAFPVAADEHLPLGGGVTTWVPFTAPCGPSKGLFELLAQREEYLLFTGTGAVFGTDGRPYGGGMLIFANQSSGTWTVVQQLTSDFACMITSGENFRPYTGPIPNMTDDDT
tara:strand:- start:745 stop:1107 length:363 start_codon:yes stop_codon:yes gene_type:complete